MKKSAAVLIKKTEAVRSITKQESVTLASFRYRLRQFLKYSESAAKKAGLSAKQHQALLSVKGHRESDAITIGKLAEHLQIAHHSAVGLVNRLTAKKLLIRRTSVEDARQVYVSVSASGERILGKLTSSHKEELRRLSIEFNSKA